jgi:condensin complex subunit 2
MDRDSAQWIKASVENKITSKNTWSSNLIDVFSDVEKFREKSTTNFQHASLLLDGSVKVYSTRVDNVVEEAEKLMECVEESRPVTKQRERCQVIDAPPEAINMRRRAVSGEDEVLEFLARESKEGDTRGLMMHLIKWSDRSGITLLRTDKTERFLASGVSGPMIVREGVLRDQGGQLRQISEMFGTFTPEMGIDDMALPLYAYHITYDSDINRVIPDEPLGQLEQMEWVGDPEASVLGGPVLEERGSVFAPTPFGYFRGWAGPGHWKVSGRIRRKKERRPRKVAQIDFVQGLLARDAHPESIFEKGECVLTHAEIGERRVRAQNILPKDFGAAREDVYRYCVQEGHFCGKGRRRPERCERDEEAHEGDSKSEADGLHGADGTPMDMNMNMDINGSGMECRMDVEERENRRGSGEQRNMCLQSKFGLFRRKKMDIIAVKEKVWEHIQGGKKSFGEICGEFKEVGAPFCLVSLLHLANEKGLELFQEKAEGARIFVCAKEK